MHLFANSFLDGQLIFLCGICTFGFFTALQCNAGLAGRFLYRRMAGENGATLGMHKKSLKEYRNIYYCCFNRPRWIAVVGIERPVYTRDQGMLGLNFESPHNDDFLRPHLFCAAVILVMQWWLAKKSARYKSTLATDSIDELKISFHVLMTVPPQYKVRTRSKLPGTRKPFKKLCLPGLWSRAGWAAGTRVELLRERGCYIINHA